MKEYFNTATALQYTYIMIPKAMMTEEFFAPLSTLSKVLYGLMLDKMGEATKNNWQDQEGIAYIVYPIEQMEKDLNASRHTVISCLNELEDLKLIERKKRGRGQPSIVYVKKFELQPA